MDLDELLARVDVDAIVDRVDINGIAQSVDIDAIAMHTDIGAMIARSSGGIAGDARDAARSQAVGLDEWIARWVARLLRRDAPAQRPHFGGAVSRFVAYAVDLGVSIGVFMLALAAISFAASIITGHSISWNRNDLPVAILFVVWEFVYFAYSWGASGKTLGMALLGVKVVAADGTRGWPAPRGDPDAGLPAQLPAPRAGLHRHPVPAGPPGPARHDRRDGGGVLLGSPRGPAPVPGPAVPGPGAPGPGIPGPELSWPDPVRGGVSPTLGDAC